MEPPASSQWMDPVEPELEAAVLNRYAGRAGSGGGPVGRRCRMEDARRGGGRAGGMKPAPIAYVLAASLALGPAAAAAAAMVEHLYEAQVIVTGQREDTRSAGLVEALLDVLVKVS